MTQKKDKVVQKRKEIKTYQDVFDTFDIKYIQHFDNVLSLEQCNKFIKMFKKESIKGNSYIGHIGKTGIKDTKRKLSSDVSLTANKHLKPYLEIFGNSIKLFINYYLVTTCYFGIRELMHYLNTHEAIKMPNTITLNNIGIRKYPKNKGGYFIPHWDRHGPHHKNRILAVILYLNDIKYGGETIFPVLEKRIQPKAGRLVLFSSDFTHLHYGNSSNEDKYILVAHIEDITNQKGEINGK